MENFKKRWEITQNWQFIYVVLGLIATFFSAYLIVRGIARALEETSTTSYYAFFSIGIFVFSFLIIKCTLWLFSKLYKRWGVTYRWELIAIFLVFAVTGSTAGKISDPLMTFLSLGREEVSGWIYWPVRILIIFPIYQVLLIFFGLIFGQYSFFKAFAIKMTSRMGFGFLFPKES